MPVHIKSKLLRSLHLIKQSVIHWWMTVSPALMDGFHQLHSLLSQRSLSTLKTTLSSEGRCQLPLLLMMLLIHANIGHIKVERSC